ncbi:hypothetical protein JCM10207_000527 [Rhodosporidiobolus poonsookiae]
MDDSFSFSPLMRALPATTALPLASAASSPTSDLPSAIDLSHHLSDLAKARLSSPLKGLYKYFQRPGMLMFAGGLPPPEYFPYETISATTLATNSFKTSQVGFGQWLYAKLFEKKTDAWEIGKYEDDPAKIQLSSALQYGTAAGLPPLAKFIYDFTTRVYRPAYADYRTVINAGSTDAWGKIVSSLCNPGDGVLAEEWTYPSALASAWPYGIKPVALPMDGEGMTPEGMDELLGSWNPDEHDGMNRPRILYTIPVAQNPTGATMTVERKKAIYDLAVKYDVIIVEDDPYYFLQAPEYERGGSTRGQSKPKKTPSDEEFLAKLVPSYLHLDYQGRVIRIDTFSKTICPGSRLGWTVANPIFAERLERANESSTQSASGFAQALVGKLLAEEWGFEGYLRWLKGIRAQYGSRRDAMVDALLDHASAHLETRATAGAASEGWKAAAGHVYELYTKDGRARDEKGFVTGEKGARAGKKVLSFVAPQGGMFIWLRIHLAAHPLYRHKSSTTLLNDLWEALAEHNLLTAPGTMFSARNFGPQPSAGEGETVEEGAERLALTEDGDGFFRISFSSATEEQMVEAAKILGKVVADYFKE